MPTSQDIAACLSIVQFRVRQFQYAQADEDIGWKHSAAEMALFDLEEAIEALRSVFGEKKNLPEN